MAGAGYKLFATGDVLTAAQVNTYLMQQTVMVFASSTARTTALTGVVAEGMVSYLLDTNATEVYDGSAWVSIANSGDITAVVAGNGLSGGATSGSATLSIDTSITVDKTTAQTLTNKTLTTPIISSISNTGTLTLPTSTDTLVGRATTDTLTNKTISASSNTLTGVINNTLTTTTGDLIYASSANTPARLAIGSSGQVLTVSGGVPTWSAAASGGGFTLLGTTVPSASSGFSYSSISSSYKHLLLTWSGIQHSGAGSIFDVRLNNDSSSLYQSFMYYGADSTLTQYNGGNATSMSTVKGLFGTENTNTGFNNNCNGYLWIYDYANTSYAKQCFASFRYYDSTAAKHIQFWADHIIYNSTSAITSVDIVRLSGSATISAATNGVVKLWGVA